LIGGGAGERCLLERARHHARRSDEGPFRFGDGRDVPGAGIEVEGHRADPHGGQISGIGAMEPYRDIRLAPLQRGLMRLTKQAQAKRRMPPAQRHQPARQHPCGIGRRRADGHFAVNVRSGALGKAFNRAAGFGHALGKRRDFLAFDGQHQTPPRRSTSFSLSRASSAAMRRATVACSMPSARAAPERLPAIAKAEKWRKSSHSI
jgi:hypothetical protein